MSSPSLKPEAPADTQSGFGRRIVISLMLGAVIFLALWFMAFSVMTSLIIGSGASVMIEKFATMAAGLRANFSI